MTAEIIERIQSAENLPSLPKVAVEVLRLAQADNASITDIADVIQQDPALTVKLLRVVNSSLFGMSRKISSLQQAMVVLGLRTVKVMVLSFSLVDAMEKGKSSSFDYAGYWRRSLTAAAAARLIAEHHNRGLLDEAFVTGLLCDIGTVAAFRCAREIYAPVLDDHDPTQETIQAAERRVLGLSHETIGADLLNRWGLPEATCSAVETHHAAMTSPVPESGTQASLTKIIRAAALIADLFCSESRLGHLDEVKRDIIEGLGIEETRLGEALEDLDKHVTETASLFALKIGNTRSYEDLQAEASAHLTRLTVAAEMERARTAEREQAARRQVEELNDQNRELAQRAATDELTGIANRAALDQRLREACDRAARESRPLGLIILDLDRFKKVNDTFGHRVGDEVLQRIGACLREMAAEDRFPTRYGGEEFAMVVTDPTAGAIRDLAEEIRLRVEEIRIPHGERTITITTSAGATHMASDGPTLEPGQLIELADRCLYEAKRRGRNRVVFTEAAPGAKLATC